MTDFIFKYGNGKTAELCQTAYNYRERNGKVVIFNAKNNENIISKINDDYYGTKLCTDITDKFDENLLFEKGFKFKKDGINIILIDNAHYLSKTEVEQLYFINKLFNIKVIGFGDRLIDNETSLGSIRFMELADVIAKVDGSYNDSIRSRLRFYYGAMNCSKTAKLLISAKNKEFNHKKVCIIKPKLDRDEKLIQSRAGLSRKADIVIDKIDNIPLDLVGINTILIDEAQFLTKKQIDELCDINNRFNIPIECYGLKSDFLTNTFDGSRRLLERADELVKLDTVCGCEKMPNAAFNARKYINGPFVKSGAQEVIDDGKTFEYISLCSRCYLEKVQEIDMDNPKKLIKRFI